MLRLKWVYCNIVGSMQNKCWKLAFKIPDLLRVSMITMGVLCIFNKYSLLASRFSGYKSYHLTLLWWQTLPPPLQMDITNCQDLFHRLDQPNWVTLNGPYNLNKIFAGTARRAGPDSMLILCVCVYLRLFLGLWLVENINALISRLAFQQRYVCSLGSTSFSTALITFLEKY